jgi:hypothetical protein
MFSVLLPEVLSVQSYAETDLCIVVLQHHHNHQKIHHQETIQTGMVFQMMELTNVLTYQELCLMDARTPMGMELVIELTNVLAKGGQIGTMVAQKVVIARPQTLVMGVTLMGMEFAMVPIYVRPREDLLGMQDVLPIQNIQITE